MLRLSQGLCTVVLAKQHRPAFLAIAGDPGAVLRSGNARRDAYVGSSLHRFGDDERAPATVSLAIRCWSRAVATLICLNHAAVDTA